MASDINRPTTRHRTTVSIDFWRDGDIIFGRQLDGSRGGTLEAAVEAMQALEELLDGERLPMMFDARAAGWMDAAAREYSRSHIGRYLTRVAVLVSWEKRQAHEYAFKDVHRETGVEVGVFTERKSAMEFLTVETATP